MEKRDAGNGGDGDGGWRGRSNNSKHLFRIWVDFRVFTRYEVIIVFFCLHYWVIARPEHRWQWAVLECIFMITLIVLKLVEQTYICECKWDKATRKFTCVNHCNIHFQQSWNNNKGRNYDEGIGRKEGNERIMTTHFCCSMNNNRRLRYTLKIGVTFRVEDVVLFLSAH